MNTSENPLVSILLPLVHVDQYGSALELLPRTIESILLQTCRNIEFLIMDDTTSKAATAISHKYSLEDKRIQYITDTRTGSQHEAFNQLSTNIGGKYCLRVVPGNLYQANFIESLVRILEKESSIDMLYANFNALDGNAKVSHQGAAPSLETKARPYSSRHPKLSNLCGYLLARNAIPFQYGLIRSEAYRKIAQVLPYDNSSANLDNLQIVRFFLKGLRCEYIDQPIFSSLSGQKGIHTREIETARPSVSAQGKPLKRWIDAVQNQLNFCLAVLKEVEIAEELKPAELVYFKALLNDSFVLHSLNDLNSIRQQLASNELADAGLFQQLLSFIKTRHDILPREEEDLISTGYELLPGNPAYAVLRLQSSTESLKVFGDLVEFAIKLAEVSSDLGRQIRKALA